MSCEDKARSLPSVDSARLCVAGLALCLGLCGAVVGAARGVGQRPPDVETKLRSMGIELAAAPAPVANYVRAVRTGNLVFLAGHPPIQPGGELVRGKLGQSLTVEEGYQAARLAGLALLASLKSEIGDLNKVSRIVKVTGMVNATSSFSEQSQVINGCSDLLVEIFGDRGKHARAAVGMASLPLGMAVEIEMIVEVADATQ